MKTKSSLTFWNRFIEVWKPTFISKLTQEKNEKKSWGFWFVSNAILALVAVGVGYIFLTNWLVDFPANAISQLDEVTVQLPDNSETTLDTFLTTGEIEVISGNLFTKNIPDPSIMILNESANKLEFYDTRKDLPAAELVLLIDSAQTKFDPTVVEFFDKGIFLFSEKAVIKQTNGPQVKIQEYKYFDIGFSGAINKESVTTFITEAKESAPPVLAVTGFVLLYLYLAVFRLVSALLWALVLWLIGNMVGIKEWNFEKSFMTVLHFKFISLIMFALLLAGGILFDGAITLVFGLLLAMNFWQITSAEKPLKD